MSARRRLAPLGWGALASLLGVAPGLALGVWQARLRGQEARLLPALEGVREASLAAMAAGVLVTAGLLWRRRGELPVGRGARVGWVLGPLLGHLALGWGLFAAWVVVDFQLFEGHDLGVQASSPDGRRTAYLYSQALFCGYEVYVAEGRSPVLRRAAHLSQACEALPKTPRLAWSADGSSVSVLDDAGQPVLDQPVPIFGPWH